MKIAGITAEYNPFHKGHAYQISKTRHDAGAQYVITVMSGDFVQRGAPAVFDKYLRAEAALMSGVDLVLELPAVYACASAEFFAAGAVSLLDSIGCVDILSFGSELGKIEMILSAAEVLTEEPEKFREALKENLKTGSSFPKARADALRSYLDGGNEVSELLGQPNNILAIEYCRALLRFHSPITPFTVKRSGKGYHEDGLSGEFASASGIRKKLFSHENAFCGSLEEILAQIPEEAQSVFLRASVQGMQSTEDYALLLAYCLLEQTQDSLSLYADIPPALARRIYKNRFACRNFESYVSLLKTRDMTYTGISRALMRLLLGISSRPPLLCPYARILGFRRDAAPLLTILKKSSRIPIISKAADAERLLEPSAYGVFCSDVRAANLYETVRCAKTGQEFRHELRRPVVIL